MGVRIENDRRACPPEAASTGHDTEGGRRTPPSQRVFGHELGEEQAPAAGRSYAAPHHRVPRIRPATQRHLNPGAPARQASSARLGSTGTSRTPRC